jgi:hypothetical protein
VISADIQTDELGERKHYEVRSRNDYVSPIRSLLEKGSALSFSHKLRTEARHTGDPSKLHNIEVFPRASRYVGGAQSEAPNGRRIMILS